MRVKFQKKRTLIYLDEGISNNDNLKKINNPVNR